MIGSTLNDSTTLLVCEDGRMNAVIETFDVATVKEITMDNLSYVAFGPCRCVDDGEPLSHDTQRKQCQELDGICLTTETIATHREVECDRREQTEHANSSGMTGSFLLPDE
jgi:hypothetical protein